MLNKIVNLSFNKQTIDIYIHNLNFDGILIINILTANFIKFELISDKTNIYSLKIYYCNKKIVLKCSYKLLPVSLKELGQIEKFPKLFFPYKFVNKNNLKYIGEIPNVIFWELDDYTEYIKNKEIDKYIYNLKKETLTYCMNDVLLTQKILNKIFDVIDLESKKIRTTSLSSPAISHKLFYSKYNSYNIDENLKLEHDSYIREAFFGGRCEVFGNAYSNEHIKYYDFSGMYGQCMLESFHLGDFAYKKPTEIKEPGFYNIEYMSNINFLPVLPSHETGKLVFYNGKGSGTFWFEEIILFEKMGGEILKINSAIIYEKFEPVFKKFVNKFNEIKKKNGYYKIFGKLMINSLYGSMALKNRESTQYITFSEKEFYNISTNTNIESFYKINECFILIIKNDYKAKAFFKYENYNLTKRNVSYSAAIASKARIKLYVALNNVIKDGARLLYCDTDSIFAAYESEKTDINTTKFEWLEKYKDAVFIAPKTYGLKTDKEIIKIKGISEKKISFDELKFKFYSEENITFNHQLSFRKADFILKQFYSSKNILINTYEKRIFTKDKKNTTPIIK